MRKHLPAIYALNALGILVLIWLIQTSPILPLDRFITREIQKITHHNFSSLMSFASFFGNGIMMVISVVFVSLLFYVRHFHRESKFVLAVLIPDFLNILIKLLIDRPRPTLEDAIISANFHQSSFPSGHVVHYVVFFGFLIAVMIVKKKIPKFYRLTIGFFSAFLIFGVSLSRIYLGAHWVTDVIGAYLFGVIYLAILLTFYLKDLVEHHGRDSEPPKT